MNDFHEKDDNFVQEEDADEQMLFTQAPPSEVDDESNNDYDEEHSLSPNHDQKDNTAEESSNIEKVEKTCNNNIQSSPFPSTLEDSNNNDNPDEPSLNNDKKLDGTKNDILIMSADEQSPNQRMEYSEAPTVVIDDISPFKPSLETKRAWIQNHLHENGNSQASGFTETGQEYIHPKNAHDAKSVSSPNREEKTTIQRTLDFDKALSLRFTDTESVHEEMTDKEIHKHDQNSNIDTECFMTQAMDHSFQDAHEDSHVDVEDNVEVEISEGLNRDQVVNDTSTTFAESNAVIYASRIENTSSKELHFTTKANASEESQEQLLDLDGEKERTCQHEDSTISIFNGETQSFPTHLQSQTPKMSLSSSQARFEQLPTSPESAAKTGYTYDSNIVTTTQYLNADFNLGSMSDPQPASTKASKNCNDDVVNNAGNEEALEEISYKESLDNPNKNGNSLEKVNNAVNDICEAQSPSDSNTKNAQVKGDCVDKGVHVLDPTPTPLHDTLSYPQESHRESMDNERISSFVNNPVKEHTQESTGPTPISQNLLEPKKSDGFTLEVANKVHSKPSSSKSTSLDEIDDSSDEDDSMHVESKEFEDKDVTNDVLANLGDGNQSDGEETQMETSKQKSKVSDIRFVSHKRNNEDSDEDNSDLKDTQESDNIPIAALKRIRRGVLKTGTTERNYEDENEDDIKWNDSDNDPMTSQFTEEVQFQLDKFASYNVKKITSNLLQTPLAENTKLRKQLNTLSSEKKELEAKNAILTKENRDLSRKLSTTSDQLKSKNRLCNEMKTKLDELQPLLEALQQVGGLHINNFQKEKSVTKTPKKPIDVKHDRKSPRKVLNFATPVTPKDDTVKVSNMVSASTRKVKRKPRIRGNTTFHDLWEILQENGWTYRQGPEPYNMVYKPPFGSVKSGSKLGIDFFEADELLWEYAISMGYIDDGEPQSQSVNDAVVEDNQSDYDDDLHTVEVISSEKNPDHTDTFSQDSNIEEWDNQKLVGQLGIMTERSRYICSKLIQSFLSGSSGGGFMATLWKPLWDCIKDEQAKLDKKLGWSYCKSIGAGKLLGRSHWFCPPCSVKRAKGIEGKDYFTTEEAVLSYVIRDLKTSNDLNLALDHKSLDQLEIKLSRAIEQHISFDEVSDISGPESVRGHRRKAMTSSAGKPKRAKRKYDLNVDSGHDVKQSVVEEVEKISNFTSDFSQRTKEGAEILAGLNCKTHDQIVAPYNSIATDKGILNVLKMRNRGSEKKRKKKEQSEMSLTIKRIKTSPQPTFHCTQDPSDISPLLNSSAKKSTNSDNSSTLPLSNLIFFGSGLDESIPKRVEYLGGVFKREIQGEDLKRSTFSKRLFFLSTPDKRRTHKYFLAVALGVPMLHVDWLEKVAEDHKQYIENGCKGSVPTAFNSENYSRYRLPLGLSSTTGNFVLQKPGNANKWLGPSDMLKGLSISIVVTDPNLEAKWSDIIRACGAHVVNSKHVDRKDVALDIALVDPVCFPPQSTAVPSKISSTLKKIKNCQQNTKVLDLAWVTNSLVLRQLVHITDRYLIEWAGRGTNVSSPKDNRGSSSKQLYSIKVNRFNKGYARYEVGDSVMFGKPDHLSYGRIESIYNDRIKRRNFVTIKIMELQNNTELMDGGSSPCMITIDEMDLYGHVILLRKQDFESVEWRHNRNVFQQRKSH